MENLISTFSPFRLTQQVLPYLEELDEAILKVISEKQPIKANQIAFFVSIREGTKYSRTDINRRLYSSLRDYVVQDEFFRWSLWEEVGTPPVEENPEDPDTEDEQGTINMDSTVKLRYSTGQVLIIKFTKYSALRSREPQLETTFVYYKSPLALAIIGKRVGDICYPGNSCVILEID